MKELSERDRQAAELSREIMELARNSILVNLRFMDRAIGNIRMKADMNYGFAGNGALLFYSPWTVIRTYQFDQNQVTRNLLHFVLHNVFRHSLVGAGIDRRMWDLAADIAVENCINDLGREFLTVPRQAKQQEAIAFLKDRLEGLTAERIYSLLDSGKVPFARIYEWGEYFTGDEHTLWYGGSAEGEYLPDDIDLDKLWKDIAKRMQTELEVFSKEDGALTQNLREVNRVRYNYTEFLRRFGARSETIRLSEEEFDNNYYTYGLELYGNIPLIEPLEYRDSRDIRDFVIAIDTSGSVEGEIVQKFIEHTHDILAQTGRFAPQMNLYIIQCDDEIRDVALITCREDFDRYLREKKITGLGRTDFRPVFTYVDKLIEEHKLRDMRGLLYFTDGKGTFPVKAPAYETAFIIHSDSMWDTWVPDWAVKLEMPTEEIMNL